MPQAHRGGLFSEEMLVFLRLCILWTLLLPQLVAAFEFRDQERIVWIGGTWFEREQREGYWETALTAALANKNIVSRNLGWSGDTIWGESRAGFDSPAEGYKRLIEHVRAEKPTLIIVGYGTNEAFEGPQGLDRFRAQFNRLLDDLADTKARLILMSPTYQVPFPGTPSPETYNTNVDRYAEIIREIAQKRSAVFIDARDWTRSPTESEALTVNGMHLTPRGYQITATRLLAALGLPAPSHLSTDQWELLRRTIVAKNELYFHRWRPQNVTYLFGFRKHEQGQNAKEIPEFDPLVEAKEQAIEKLKKASK
jgi:lysophospholipase L1-like esterase